MKQYDAVIKTMEENGGYATLGYLNQNVFKIRDCEWKTKTPFASVRRIVQDSRFFFRIKPGLWALKSYRDRLPVELLPKEQIGEKHETEYNHSYYQGLLLEIGNIKNFSTFIPNQDKNKLFLGKKLSDISTLDKIYNFTYDQIIRKAQTIDVIWFNRRKMPQMFFEVEHSTNIQNSLIKFVELQDFYTKFFIVSDILRKPEFQDKVELEAFKELKGRVRFLDYEKLAEWHSKTFESAAVEKSILYN